MSDDGRVRLAEEAVRFLDALRAATGATGETGTAGTTGTTGTTGQSVPDGDGFAAHAGPECRVCPVCRGLAALRQVRPEAVEHLATAVSELALAVREVLAPGGAPATAQDQGGPPSHAAEPGRAGSRAGRQAGVSVQHIDITD